MKTEMLLMVTYLNPNYEPGKTVREITENLGVVKDKTITGQVEARKYAENYLKKKGLRTYAIEIKNVPILNL